MRNKKTFIRGSLLIIALLLSLYFLQGPFAHRFDQENIDCQPLLGWFTKEDIMTTKENGLDASKLQPGDIIVTLSNHSLGWRHGHAAIVINQKTTLECAVLGKDSICCDINSWKKYSNYAVLRVKGADVQKRKQVAYYGEEALQGVPYHLSAGFIGPKAPEIDAPYFGMQCAYLVWYAWKHFGYDLDSDGGRLVTVCDLLDSELVEIVQSYGMEL